MRFNKYGIVITYCLSLALLFYIILLFSVNIKVKAQDENISNSVTIYPSIIDLDVNLKEVINKTVSFKNDLNFPLPVKAEISDYTIDEYGIPDFNSNNYEWNPRDWISASPSDFIVDALSIKEINIAITIPENANNGSHFAVMLFKPVMPPQYFEEESLHIIPYIGGLIILNVIQGDYSAKKDIIKIQEFNVNEITSNRQVEFTENIKNEDVYYHKINREIKIINIFNKEVGNISIPDTTIFPLKNRILNDNFESKLLFGRYKAVLLIEAYNEVISETTYFWIFPNFTIIFFSFIIFIVLVLLILKRKNLSKALKVLILNKAPLISGKSEHVVLRKRSRTKKVKLHSTG